MQLEIAIAFSVPGSAIFCHQDRVGVAQQALVGCQTAPIAAAEQLIDGLVGKLANNIPQRDIDPGKGIDHGAIATEQVQRLLHFMHQASDVTRIPTNEEGRDQRVQCCLGSLVDHMTEGFAPAGNACIGFYFHQQRINVRPWLPGEQLRRSMHVKGNGNYGSFYRGNFHDNLFYGFVDVPR